MAKVGRLCPANGARAVAKANDALQVRCMSSRRRGGLKSKWLDQNDPDAKTAGSPNWKTRALEPGSVEAKACLGLGDIYLLIVKG